MSRCQVCGNPDHYEDWHSPERVAARAEEEAEELRERVDALEERVRRLEQKMEER